MTAPLWHCTVRVGREIEVIRVRAKDRTEAKLVASECFGTVSRNVTSAVKIG